jgi:response regulator NasT
LICEDEGLTVMRLRASLGQQGYKVVGEVANGAEAASAVTRLQPDVILMDIRMPGLDGIAATRQIMATWPTPIVMLTAFTERELIDAALEAGASGYLVKPITDEQLEPAITVALRRFADLHELRGELSQMQEALESRKLVERAKGVLMRHYHLSESEAHRRLQKMSRERRQPVVKTAEQVLAAVEVLG